MCGQRYPYILGGTFMSRYKKNTTLRYDVSYFSEKYPYENFSQYMLWGVRHVILQLWKKSRPI
jgi:hypothetical protein